jgi:dolichol-phosphate mannosyltransferase
MTGRIYLGLPAYNEEIALPRLLGRIEKLSASLPHALTVVVYDDGSTDATATIAQQWQSRMPLALLDGGRNKGLGAGLRALVAHAMANGGNDDVLVIMDCDDTHDPMQLIDMLAAMAKGADVVIASRFTRGASVTGVPLLRRMTAMGAVLLFKTVHPVRNAWDYTCGYRAYRIGALQRAAGRYHAGLVEESGFACMTELLLKLNGAGLRFAEIPLQLRYDQKPTASKMDVSSNIGRMLGLLLRWRLRGLGAS